MQQSVYFVGIAIGLALSGFVMVLRGLAASGQTVISTDDVLKLLKSELVEKAMTNYLSEEQTDVIQDVVQLAVNASGGRLDESIPILKELANEYLESGATVNPTETSEPSVPAETVPTGEALPAQEATPAEGVPIVEEPIPVPAEAPEVPA